MKKIGFLLMTALMLVAVSPLAQAQEENDDNMLFNHMSIGVDWGLLGRVGADVALPVTNMLNMRVGFNTMGLFFAAARGTADDILAKQNPDLKGIDIANLKADIDVDYHDNGMDIDKVNLSLTPSLTNAELLFDFFPARKSTFHITAGAFFAFNPLLHAVGSAVNASGQPGIPKSDWASTRFYGLSTDTNGQVLADIKYGLNYVKPYVGIGFGRPVAMDRRVGFVFDLGVYVIGGLHLYSYDYTSGSPKAVEINEAWLNQNPDIKENVKLNQEVLDAINIANGFPVLPMMRFSLFVRLF